MKEKKEKSDLLVRRIIFLIFVFWYPVFFIIKNFWDSSPHLIYDELLIMPHDVTFKLEYDKEGPFFKNAAVYTVRITYIEDGDGYNMGDVGSMTITHLVDGDEDSVILPDPNCEEIYFSEDLKCYLLFNRRLFYLYNEDRRGYSYWMDVSIDFTYMVDEPPRQFLPIALILANADIDNQEVKKACQKYVEIYHLYPLPSPSPVPTG